MYVHESIAEEFIAQAVAEAKAYILGDPREPGTTLGPVVRQRNADLIRNQITRALDAGAHPHIDAAAYPVDRPDRPYLSPQILTNVNHTMDIMTQETFGPCVGIMRVTSDEEAVQLMNDSEFGLTASVWTQDYDAALALSESVEAGTVFTNRCDYLDPALAWTGVKNSGRGATLSAVGFEHLTRAKSFHIRKEL